MSYSPSPPRARSIPLQPLDVVPPSRAGLGDNAYGAYADAIPHVLHAIAAEVAAQGSNVGMDVSGPGSATSSDYKEALPLQQVSPTSVGPAMTNNGSLETCFFYRSPNPTVRQRTAQACDKCRDRKAKCTGARPTCKRCDQRGLTCHYATEGRRGGNRPKEQGMAQAENDASLLAAPQSDSGHSSSSVSLGPLFLELPARPGHSQRPPSANSDSMQYHAVAPLLTQGHHQFPLASHDIPPFPISHSVLFAPNGDINGRIAGVQPTLSEDMSMSPPPSATSMTFTDASSSMFSDPYMGGLPEQSAGLREFMGYGSQTLIPMADEAMSSPSPGSSSSAQINDDLMELMSVGSLPVPRMIQDAALCKPIDLGRMSDEELNALHDTLYAQVFGVEPMLGSSIASDTVDMRLEPSLGEEDFLEFLNTEFVFGQDENTL